MTTGLAARGCPVPGAGAAGGVAAGLDSTLPGAALRGGLRRLRGGRSEASRRRASRLRGGPLARLRGGALGGLSCEDQARLAVPYGHRGGEGVARDAVLQTLDGPPLEPQLLAVQLDDRVAVAVEVDVADVRHAGEQRLLDLQRLRAWPQPILSSRFCDVRLVLTNSTATGGSAGRLGELRGQPDVDVAAQHDDVRSGSSDDVEDLAALVRVAVPLVVVRARAIDVDQLHLHQRLPDGVRAGCRSTSGP